MLLTLYDLLFMIIMIILQAEVGVVAVEGEAMWEAGLSGGWGEEEGVGSGGGRVGLSDGFRWRLGVKGEETEMGVCIL